MVYESYWKSKSACSEINFIAMLLRGRSKLFTTFIIQSTSGEARYKETNRMECYVAYVT